jgi:hypothetical protein
VRAGLLSDPRVVVALRTLFVPVHMTALNTAHCLHDARDEALLKSMAGDATDRFVGGEREAFVLPDGVMQSVFLSLGGYELNEVAGRASHYTAAGRRADNVTRMFRHHGAKALRAVHDETPAAWRELWDDESPAVNALLDEKPRWPMPIAGQQGLRVFVRNSHLRYDDLHGAQILALGNDAVGAWAGGLSKAGDRAQLPRPVFEKLVNAMVPRGSVDPELAPTSIGGTLELVAAAIDGDRITGVVAGAFAMQPKDRSEGGKRPSAAILFEASGQFVGRFTWDRATTTFAELRVATRDVEFAWQPVMATGDDFPPHYFAAFEWVRGEAPAR